MRRSGDRNLRLTTVLALAIFAFASLAVAQVVVAQGDPFSGPNRNFDGREEALRGAERAPSALQQSRLEAFQSQVPGLTYRVDPATGATRSLTSSSGYLTAASRSDAVTTAKSFLEANATILGLNALDVSDYAVRDVVPSSVSGSTHVYLQQRHAGLSVYNALYQTNMDREGRITGVANGFMPSIASAVTALQPKIQAARAVVAAAEHLRIPIVGVPRVLDRDKSVERVTSIDPSGISAEPITARLMILPILAGEARLVWNFQIYTLDHQHWFDMNVDTETGKVWTRFDWVASDQYRVYEVPAESPNHVQGGPFPPADGRALVVDPADPTASPSTWHSGNLTEGNNVRAYEDSNSTNSGTPVNCGGSQICDFALDLTQAPSTYRPAAVSNLFYWNNIIHDILYQYGFDEASGNFQENNFGNGGAGSDSVNAEAQDGSGTNNANFATPSDGSNPRMQMFIWTAPNPDKDGDLDNGIVIHEYGHGISNRLVGGPTNVSCLGNSQQPGEGWSDWYALALTGEVGDTGADPRGIGTYALDEPTSGPGIRTQRYSTDPAVNTWTYESIRSAAVPHGVGSVWAQAIWEVYWGLVDQHGFDPDIYNATGGAGNQRALLYVTEGLKNTACSPTFLDSRDGIIQAVLNNNPADECIVWQAFADFGLGVNATTTGSNSSATNGFDVPVQCQCSPQPIADAGPDQTICLGSSTTVGTPARAGHTYSWSPGGQTTAEINVSPTTITTYSVTATTTCGSANDSATITVNDGSGGGLSEDFEGGLGGWTAGGLWHLTTDSTCASPGYSSPFNALYYGQDSSCDYSTGGSNSGDLVSPSIAGLTASSTLSFDFFREVESFSGDYDWTRVDVSDNGGASWTTVWSQNARDASQNAWVSSGAISLAAYAGSTIQVRFNFDTIDGVANTFTGWFIDDVVVSAESQCTGGNQDPTATISAPADASSFDEQTSISFAGTGNDAEDGDVTASLTWSSSIDGALGTGGSFSAVLSLGTHTITATATDSQGATGSDSITVSVVNVDPTVTITAPAGGSSFNEGDTVNFAGTATDPEGDLSTSISWSSSVDGPLGTGASVSATLSVGSHTITASATDSNGGTGSDSITVSVVNVNPTVTITAPADGTVVDEGTSVNFTGTASDPGDGDLSASILWSSSIDGALGTGASISTTLSVGTHTVTASVTDSNGAPGSDAITVTVSPNGIPAVSITSPADGSSVNEGSAISFVGSATDPEDGDLTASLLWSSSLDGAIGSGASFSLSTLSVGTHTITASVTDSGGLSGTDSVTVTIDAVGGGNFVDWNVTSTVAYSNQDNTGTIAIEDGGATFFMQGNRWRRTQATFAVTANTVIEFEFQSTSEGEIHGIGFDEDDTLTNGTRIFELYGTQNWGGAFHNFDNQYSPVGSFQSYTIPVGDFYTGAAMRLVLVNDKDSGSGTNTSRFRNVRIFENVPPPPPPGCVITDFETGTSEGWTNSAASTCSTGTLIVGAPVQIVNGGVTTQVGGDHTSGGSNAFYTAANTSAGVNDVDSGTCIAESGVVSVTEASDVSLWYFHGQRDAGDDAGDFFSLEISTNGGSTWSTLTSFGDVRVNAVWTEVTTTVPAGSDVRFRLQVADAAGPGDLVEAGVDDIMICPVAP